MQIKLFGKNLFEINKDGGNPKAHAIFNNALDELKKSDFLIDFYKDTGGNSWGSEYFSIAELTEISVNTKGELTNKKKKAVKKVAPKPVELTPKDVYTLKTLNDDGFKIKVDEAYVDEQLATFKEKLGMIKTKEFDMNRGTIEIGSVISRFENRKKYAEHKDFYEEFPYTTNTKIAELVKEHSYLKMGEVSQFLADMPKEAVDTMKRYTDQTKKLCEKKPVFYIIANKKDFQKTESRRDPILLAQSPFGHFWQILGAWDEEMLLLEEL